MNFIKKFFGGADSSAAESSKDNIEHDVRVATCAIFIEMAGIDGEFSDAERNRIVTLLQQQFDLSPEHAAELQKVAGEKLEGSIDIWQFTNRINQNYTVDEKMEVMELVWRVVYADGKLDAHENYLVRKLATLLRLSHSQMIDAKLRAKRKE